MIPLRLLIVTGDNINNFFAEAGNTDELAL
jgi:hypothetical protein